MITIKGRHLGGARSDKDPRDFKFPRAAPALVEARAIPATFDPRANHPPIWDQGQLGSCSFHGGSRALVLLHSSPSFMPARMAGYFWGRDTEGNSKTDSGCQTRDMLKVLQAKGLYGENFWPYDVTKFADRPPDLPDAEALTIGSYTQISSYEAAKEYIFGDGVNGLGMTFAVALPTYFEDAPLGVMKVYQNELTIGEHEMCAVGWIDDFRSSVVAKASGVINLPASALIVANSWGDEVGDEGYWYFDPSIIFGDTLGNDAWGVH